MKRLVHVATDGHRLAATREAKHAQYAVSKDVVRKNLLAVVPFYEENGIYTQAVETEYDFPDFRQVIPQSYNHELTIDLRQTGLFDLLKAIKTVKHRHINRSATGPKHTPVLIIDPKNKHCYTSRQSDALFLALPFEDADITGEGPRFGINALYLLDALKSLKDARCTRVDLQYTDATSAMVLRGGDDMHVIMPMRLSDQEPVFKG